MTQQERETAIQAYCDAYERANGYRPKRVHYRNGWYRLPMTQCARHDQLIEYTERLLSRPAKENPHG